MMSRFLFVLMLLCAGTALWAQEDKELPPNQDGVFPPQRPSLPQEFKIPPKPGMPGSISQDPRKPLPVSPLDNRSKPVQALEQMIRGQVRDEYTLHPLKGARIVVSDSTFKKIQESDDKGEFTVDNVPYGRHAVRVSLDGYEEYYISDLDVIAGKDLFLDIRLTPFTFVAEGATIVARERTRQLMGVSLRSFTVEETRRFAATYFDPARLATSFPGVTSVNDQANHISIRGNSPNGLVWRLEGVDIVNPNHLNNAGTFSDRPSLAGGGVNILSAQMMAASNFSAGAFDARYGNALSGVMDISLRKANHKRDEYTLQFGLLGLDISAEGPVGDKEKGSFIGNYRYSTVGLLNRLGISFGDERINFQDLAVNTWFDLGKAGSFTVFAMGGKSNNFFDGQRVDSLRRNEKDRLDIAFKNRMGALGATHTLLLGSKTLIRTVAAASAGESERLGSAILDSLSTRLIEEDRMSERRLSLTSSITHKFGTGLTVQLGGFANQISFDLRSRSRTPADTLPLRLLAAAQGQTLLLQPYLRTMFRYGQRISGEAGVHVMRLMLNGATAIEPRGSLRYQIGPKHSISAAYGLHSQMQPLSYYFTPSDSADGVINYVNRNLGFTRAHHAVLSYARRITETLSVKAEPYVQQLFNVPVVSRPGSTFSALNLIEGVIVDTLQNSGSGRNYGVELSIEQTLHKTFYFLLSGSYYRSLYKMAFSDTLWRSTRFDGRYAGSLSIGKEFSKTKETARRTWGIDLRALYQGGFLAMPIDTLGSIAAGTTLYQSEKGFAERLPDFFRLDLRLSHKRNKPGYTRTIALDIQNASNRQNIAWRYYDPVLGAVQTRFQLGIIPLLTYRVEY